MTPKVTIIAEAGVNHNGSLDLALDLVDAASDAGADLVKFQTFRAVDLVTASAPRAEYQESNTGDSGSQLEMLQQLELSHEDHYRLIERCKERGIGFLSTPFDPASLDFLVHDLDLPIVKLGSSELTNAPLLVAAGRSGKQFILSTGMGTLDEVEAALGALSFGYNAPLDHVPGGTEFQSAWAEAKSDGSLQNRVSILHCTTAYPTPAESVNLSAISTIRDAFGLPVGFSDHTTGAAAACASIALGARIVEKHITLDKSMPGPDHKASLEPDEFFDLVQSIRFVATALGDGIKKPQVSEEPNMPIARKSLVAAMNIAKGDEFTDKNVVVMRPGTGLSPFEYWDCMGKTSLKSYRVGDVIKADGVFQ